MNVKSVILIVAALLFAGGTAFVASRLMGQKPVQQVQVQEAPGKKVLVAKGNLPAGTFLKEEDVSWQKWPTDGVNDNYLLEGQADINNVVGAVVRKGIVAGERIDVLLNMQFTIKELSPDGQPQTSDYRPQTSETVLENVRLLATDRNLNDIEGEPKKINTVTIEVTPKQAEMIKVAATMGQLALSLRGLGMPDGKAGGPTVASAQTAATSFFAQQAADTPGGPEESKPKDKSGSSASDDDPVPQRGETYTYDTEVSRPMNELMHPTDKNVVQIVRGSNTGDPAIQNIVPQ